MYLSKIRVRNYKSFRDSGDIEFKPGINIIVGQNNVGKTALLEALELKFSDNPHKNLKTNENKTHSGDKLPLSKAFISIHSPHRDIESLSELYSSDIVPLHYYVDEINKLKEIKSLKMNERYNIPVGEDVYSREEECLQNIKKFIKEFNISLTNGITFNVQCNQLGFDSQSFHIDFINKSSKANTIEINLFWNNKTSKFEFSPPDSYNKLNKEGCLGWEQANIFKEYIYRFYAERFNNTYSGIGTSRTLKPNASNLAEVLHTLNANNPSIYQKYINLVNEVIPSVKWVTSPIIEVGEMKGMNYGVNIWNIDASTERENLTIPLSECGTGIGQVLAILYVVVTSKDTPRTIIIDEPNSFLHPSASKKLIQILNKFPQHQYFVSTHSPEILATANPSTVTMLKYEDGETKVEQLDLSQGNDKLKLVSELGMEISDFFFAENILWVEGPTEAKAFPLILQNSKSLFDFVAVPLVHTDDLKDRKRGRKHAKTNIENIRRLSGEYALTPPKIFTVLDREDTSNQEIQDLEKLEIQFIPRRLFENYLLDAEAITEVLNDEILEESDKITSQQIEDILTASQTEFSDNKEWLEKVHGAKLLEKIFSELSKTTVEYRKTTHSVELTKLLLENKSEQLQELQIFLLGILEKTE